MIRKLVGHLKEQLNAGSTDSEVLSWLRQVMPPVITPTQEVEMSVPKEDQEELPEWAPPQPEASAWQSPKSGLGPLGG